MAKDDSWVGRPVRNKDYIPHSATNSGKSRKDESEVINGHDSGVFRTPGEIYDAAFEISGDDTFAEEQYKKAEDREKNQENGMFSPHSTLTTQQLEAAYRIFRLNQSK